MARQPAKIRALLPGSKKEMRSGSMNIHDKVERDIDSIAPAKPKSQMFDIRGLEKHRRHSHSDNTKIKLGNAS